MTLLRVRKCGGLLKIQSKPYSFISSGLLIFFVRTGPPPQYTPEDRSPEEPMHHPGDLDLNDPSTLPPSERPPDLPPPMAMLPSNRRMPSYEDDLSKFCFSLTGVISYKCTHIFRFYRVITVVFIYAWSRHDKRRPNLISKWLSPTSVTLLATLADT